MTVDEYIYSFDENTSSRLKAIHSLILNHFPDITYRYSYQMIGYFYHKKRIYIGAFKTHIGIYGGFDPKLAESIPQIKHKNSTFYLSLEGEIPFDEILHIFSNYLK